MANGYPGYPVQTQVGQPQPMAPGVQPVPVAPGAPVAPVPAQPGYPQVAPVAQAPTQPVAPQMPPGGPQAAPMAPVAPAPMGAPQPAVTAPVVGVAPGQMPQYHLPDDAAVLQAYQQHREETASWGSGTGPQYVKWLGPAGQTTWDGSVPPGHDASVYAYILPPWAAGKGIFREVKTHFFKSMAHPRGMSIGCPGSAQCLVCQAKEAAMSHPDPQVVKRAKDFGRVRTQYLYNVVCLENPNGHYGQDGQLRPFILGAGALLHKAIGDIIEDKQGAINIVDPMRGRPIRLKKSKTGPELMNVEYAAIAQDPMPLDPFYYACLQNIHDLDAQDRQPTMEDMVKAVQEMGLPLPAGMGAPALPMAAPAAAFANPYPGTQVGQSQGPVHMPPPADPYQVAPPPAPAAQQPYVPAGHPAQAVAPAPMAPAPLMAPPVASAPPPLQTADPMAVEAPPAIQSAPVATNYQPQPGQVPVPPPPGTLAAPAPAVGPGGVPPAPAVTAPPGVAPMPQPVAPQAPAPVAPGAPVAPAQPDQDAPIAPVAPAVSAPGAGQVTKPPCFGKHNPQDRTCAACPDGLKAECMGMAGQSAAPVQPPQDLQQLQGQLTGQG